MKTQALRRAGKALLLAGALATAAVPALAAPLATRVAGQRPDPSTDEAGLWQMSDKAEAQAKASSELDGDPALNAYVRDVTCKVAQTYCSDLRIYVLDRPYFNAAVAPNGYVEVWSGLLLRAQDESQLAFVLGHEISHFAENHSLASWRAAKARTNAATVVSIGIAIASMGATAGASPSSAQSIANAASSLQNLVYLGALVSLFSFSREQESQADSLGFQRAVAAGYDPNGAAGVWSVLIDESRASDFPKVRTSETRASVFDTHPLTLDRRDVLAGMAKGLPPGDSGKARYRAMIRPHLAAWLRDDLSRRDYGESLYLIGRLMSEGEDLGLLNYFKGEAYRLRRGAGDLDQAKLAYEAAAAQSDAPAETWRELGDIYARDGDKPKARQAYEAYLAKAPDAEDAWLVQASLGKL